MKRKGLYWILTMLLSVVCFVVFLVVSTSLVAPDEYSGHDVSLQVRKGQVVEISTPRLVAEAGACGFFILHHAKSATALSGDPESLGVGAGCSNYTRLGPQEILGGEWEVVHSPQSVSLVLANETPFVVKVHNHYFIKAAAVLGVFVVLAFIWYIFFIVLKVAFEVPNES